MEGSSVGEKEEGLEDNDDNNKTHILSTANGNAVAKTNDTTIDRKHRAHPFIHSVQEYMYWHWCSPGAAVNGHPTKVMRERGK